MSSFTTPLVGEWTNDDMTQFKLTQEFEYVANDGSVYSVPIGFITDFASTPKWLRWLIPPIGKYGKAAVLHDYLYKTHSVGKNKADQLFLEAMQVLKVHHWNARIMYEAVVIFGEKEYLKGGK
ncbi:DUF1353 domain-containing protein [Sulfuricurvum sp.]|uniref:DUF1353 domain-containing protein n=1 Tax=Sulfuricurvum sp. TaxID=2025608 RepID=UPI002606EDD8|nr:DUF1353 domain-containing protein [Sulfuricurvum sp.]MDD2267464.1 DUF1353 domain-containing protein [Sulfuricurvum sp.]MDD2782815.1 DUF1353 domain-containing protein [Sulfuricurvum sp.]